MGGCWLRLRSHSRCTRNASPLSVRASRFMPSAGCTGVGHFGDSESPSRTPRMRRRNKGITSCRTHAASARAAELEGGERALRQIDLVARAITTYGNVGLSYQMVGPVQVSGNTLTAPLQISVVGRGSQNRSMTFVWSGNKWKLSNRSVCTIAGFVLLPCSL